MEKSIIKRMAVVIMALVLTITLIPTPRLQAATNVGDFEINLTKKGTKPSISISKNTSITLVAKDEGTVIPASSLKFKSSNKKIADVSSNGVVTGKKSGKTKITITYKAKVNKKTVSKKSVLSVTVAEFIDVNKITLSNTSLSLYTGNTASLSAVVTPRFSSSVTWRSFIPEIATVDQNGNVTAISPGTGVIAACAGTKTEICRVTVTDGGGGSGSGGGYVPPAPDTWLAKTKLGDTDTYAEGIDNTLYITGTGAMPDFSESAGSTTAPWFFHHSEIKRIEIGEGITYVGAYAFYGHTALESVSFPSTLNTIGQSAFQTAAIPHVFLPKSVTEIGKYAFAYCNITSLIVERETVHSWNELNFRDHSFYSSTIACMFLPDYREIGLSSDAFASTLLETIFFEGNSSDYEYSAGIFSIFYSGIKIKYDTAYNNR